eukprot:TRINITY_DN6780_c0_g1_i5.p1 TRINITY_DN6780_c0_g1~~TRINITY_DN6780_c0_g1_i5.p1  ORF type:complete len:202 (-),score=17.45 TRINITY_DN6780_c0_g1_i5:26-631(-)
MPTTTVPHLVVLWLSVLWCTMVGASFNQTTFFEDSSCSKKATSIYYAVDPDNSCTVSGCTQSGPYWRTVACDIANVPTTAPPGYLMQLVYQNSSNAYMCPGTRDQIAFAYVFQLDVCVDYGRGEQVYRGKCFGSTLSLAVADSCSALPPSPIKVANNECYDEAYYSCTQTPATTTGDATSSFHPFSILQTFVMVSATYMLL